MTILLLLMPIAIALGFIGLIAFFWAMRSGQWDDLEGEGHRVLIERDEPLDD